MDDIKIFTKNEKEQGTLIQAIRINIKLATVIEGDPKAPFLIATTPMCWGEHYAFPLIAPLFPYYMPYNSQEVS